MLRSVHATVLSPDTEAAQRMQLLNAAGMPFGLSKPSHQPCLTTRLWRPVAYVFVRLNAFPTASASCTLPMTPLATCHALASVSDDT